MTARLFSRRRRSFVMRVCTWKGCRRWFPARTDTIGRFCSLRCIRFHYNAVRRGEV